MSLDQFWAVVEGYSETLVDSQMLAVQSGYWSGYYSGAQRKKSVKAILDGMQKSRYRKPGERAPDVDVEAFLATERAFREAQRKLEGNSNGE